MSYRIFKQNQLHLAVVEVVIRESILEYLPGPLQILNNGLLAWFVFLSLFNEWSEHHFMVILLFIASSEMQCKFLINYSALFFNIWIIDQPVFKHPV